MIPFEDRDYLSKREELRRLAKEPEISHCVDTLADEIYIHVRYHGLENLISWQAIKHLLIDGFIAFESIYETKQKLSGNKHVRIGLKELDPATLVPTINSESEKVWVQYPEDANLKRVFYPSQIVYISYSDNSMRLSYVESLMRAFGNMKAVEDIVITSAVTNPGSGITAFELEYFKNKFKEASKIPYDESRVQERWNRFTRKIFDNIKQKLSV